MADEIPTFEPDQPSVEDALPSNAETLQAVEQAIPTFEPDDPLTIQGPPEEFNEIPIFIPEAPEPGEGGIFRGLLTPPEPIENDLRGAFKSGVIQETLTGNIALGTEKLIREQILGQDFQAPPPFIPKTTAEEVAKFTGSFFDPALGPIGKVAGAVIKPFITPAASASVKLGKKFGLNKALRRALFRTSVAGATGVAQFGSFAGASEALRQSVNDEEFDVEKIAINAALGGAAGAFFNPGFAALGRAMKKTATKKQLIAKARFEAKPAGALPTIASQEQVRSAGQLINTLDSLDNNMKLGFEKLGRGGLSKIEERSLKQSILKTDARKSRLENDFLETINGPEYRALRTAQQAMPDAEIIVAGQKVNAWKKSISPRNVVVTPEELNFYMGLQDRTITSVAQAPVTDIVRLTHEIDGTIRGRVMREVVEPSLNASTAKLVEEQALRKSIDEAAKRLPNKSTKRLAQLFDQAEGKAQLTDIKGEEIDFLNFTNKTYSSLIDRINEVNSRYNLPLVKKRKNYITHLVDLKDQSDLGIFPGEILSKKATTFPFQKRTGELTRKNPIESLDAYVGPALRRIHMTQPASDALARVQVMPPRLRKAYTNWIEGPVLGGIDPKDKFFLNEPMQTILKGAETLSAGLTGSVILGSLNVAVQQPSQTLATALQTGVRNTVRGLAQGLKTVPKELADQSNFLTARSIFQESVALKRPAFKKFQSFAGGLVESADRFVARSTWNAAYIQGREKMQLSPEASIRYADTIGQMLHANYRELYKPPLLRGKTGKAFFPFQSFAVNMWNHITRDPKVLAELRNTSKAREVMKVVGAMLGTNQIYDALGLPPPFKIGSETIPFAGQLKFGVPSPPIDLAVTEFKGVQGIEESKKADLNRSIIGNLYLMGLADDPEIREEAFDKLKGIGLKRFIPMGSQILNTVEGLEAAQQGYYEVGHEDVDIEGLDKTISILLGPRKTKAFRELQKEKKVERRERLLGK